MVDQSSERTRDRRTRLHERLGLHRVRDAVPALRADTALLVAVIGLLLVGVLVPAVFAGSGAPPSGSSAGHLSTYGAVDRTDGDVGVREASAVQRPAVDDRIASLHDRGVTGEGTTVGIVGSSFDPTDDAIAAAVSGHRTVDTGSPTVAPPHEATHDTAVAEVVLATAPDADIEMVGIGPDPTVHEYRTALQLLVDADVDVVVDAGSYFPRDAETAAAFARAADEAAEETVLVTSAGNLGERHWAGTRSGTGWVSFDESPADAGSEGTVLRDQANRVGDGPIAGDVSIRLHWEALDPGADPTVELYLYRQRPSDPDVAVAKATGEDGLAAIDVTVPRGTYYVAIHRPGEPTPLDLALYAPTHDLQYADAGGSIPPTVGEHAIAVGAEPPDRSAPIRPDSSRSGVTLVGPGAASATTGELSGTSAAAPYVGGTAALLVADGDASSGEVRDLLLETADRRGDVARIDPGAAVDASASAANESEPQRSVDESPFTRGV